MDYTDAHSLQNYRENELRKFANDINLLENLFFKIHLNMEVFEILSEFWECLSIMKLNR